MKMANTRLLQAVCTVAMLAAVPAFAQMNTPPGATGPGGTPNPAAHRAMPGQTSGSGSSMAPAAKDGLGTSASDESHATHRSAMAHPMGMKHGRTDASQHDAVNNLNDQSYQAAQKGEAFGGRGSDAASSDMTKPGGSRGMNDMSGGSMSGSGGSMSGGAMPSPGSDGTGSKP
jgi:hypothetical protein